MLRDKINIVIPLFNPHAGWENNFVYSLLEMEKELKETDYTVILVNDGSSGKISNLEEIMEKFKFLKYFSYPVNMGKGYAIRYGISHSYADFYIYTDIDFPFGCRIILQTYELLKSSKTDIVIGTRDSSYFGMLPIERRIISFLLKKVNWLVTGFKIKDTQAGLKGLNNEARKVLENTKTNSFIFELEFLNKSIKQGLSFKTIKVSCKPGTKFTNFSSRIIWKEIMSFLKIFLKIGKKDTVNL
jgi:glycosyltransferase involved in cell wall biosynthesis